MLSEPSEHIFYSSKCWNRRTPKINKAQPNTLRPGIFIYEKSLYDFILWNSTSNKTTKLIQSSMRRRKMLESNLWRVLGMQSGQCENDGRGLKLPQVLNLAEARPLARELLALRGRDLVLDASAVEHMGAPCAQVLLSALGTWRVDGLDFAFDAPSAGFREGARLLGLDATFGGEA